jgi:threonine/homoserine/homoserine lactone efflux protein
LIAFKVLLFGLTLAVAVGPIALLILGYGTRHGLRAGSPAALGAALADFTYALAAFFLGNRLAPHLEAHEAGLRLTASLVLVGLGAWMAWTAWRDRAKELAAAEAKPGLAGPLATIYLLTLVNPLTLLLFLGISAQLPLAGSPLRAAGYAACLFLGSLLGQMIFAVGGAGLGRILTDRRWIFRLNLASGVAIVLFGLAGLRASG